MGRPSKFTADRRAKILQALRIGASQRSAAAMAGVDHRTLGRWLAEGRTARDGSTKRRFAEEVAAAEAEPKVRALVLVHEAMPDNPMLAFRFLEAREPGFGRIAPETPEPTPGETVIQLKLPGPGPRGLPPPDPDGEPA